MLEKSLAKLAELSSELADVETVILLLLDTKDDYGKLEVYNQKKQDLEQQIMDLKER